MPPKKKTPLTDPTYKLRPASNPVSVKAVRKPRDPKSRMPEPPFKEIETVAMPPKKRRKPSR